MSKTQKNRKQIFIWRKACILPVFLVVITAMSLSVYAYLKWSAAVENTFTGESSVIPTINETFDKKIKTGVTISPGNTEYSVYIRAAIVATWVNSDGEVHGNVPVPGIDYELNLNTTDWFEKDGFYYHKVAVASEKETKVLLNSCRALKEAPKDRENPDTKIYTLNVEIVTQTIQAAGMTDEKYDNQGNEVTAPIPLVTAAWDVTVDETTKNLKP